MNQVYTDLETGKDVETTLLEIKGLCTRLYGILEDLEKPKLTYLKQKLVNDAAEDLLRVQKNISRVLKNDL